MKEFKGTKGKWKFQEQGEANSWVVLSEENKNWILSITQNGELLNEKQIANARLISAAPDLLETLQELYELLEEELPRFYLLGHSRRAKNAIKKATK